LTAAAATGGKIELDNVNIEHLQPIVAKLRESGSTIYENGNKIYLIGPKENNAIDIIRTLPYPGFPTDMQAPIMSLLVKANGTSTVIETIFENRFKHVDDLICMGANIRVYGRVAIINGKKNIVGKEVTAKDLRGGAALIIAGLSAEGTTIVDGVEHIDRGYEDIEKNFQSIGAEIKRD